MRIAGTRGVDGGGAAALSIDWGKTTSPASKGLTPQGKSAPSSWQLDFLNNAGRKALNPNAALRITI